MSGDTAAFLIVEGRTLDKTYLGSLCDSSSKLTAAGYQIWLVEEVTNGSAGKTGVLDMLEYCRKRRKLRCTNSHGSRSIGFLVDHDADTLCRQRKRSKHLFYTTHADVEAEEFAYGNDIQALMCSLSIDRPTTERTVSGLGDWRMEFAELWREWILLCCVAKSLSAHCKGLRFGHISDINVERYGQLSETRRLNRMADVRTKAALVGAPNFDSEYSRVARHVAKMFNAGNGFLLVKGKWVPGYLKWRIQSLVAGRVVDLRDFEKLAAKMYLSRVDFSSPRLSRMREAVEQLVAQTGSSDLSRV